MRPEDYTVIQGWMYSLDLTDKQRIAYAIIWGYSRDGRSVCRTTAKQLAEWLDCSVRHAQRIVNELEDRGLIGHEVVAVSARRGHSAGVMTDFWAVLPEDAAKPEKTARIDWAGRGKVTTRMSQPGYDTDVVTPYKGSNNQKHLTGGGEKNARSRAKDTTTTGFLFAISNTRKQRASKLSCKFAGCCVNFNLSPLAKLLVDLIHRISLNSGDNLHFRGIIPSHMVRSFAIS